MQKNCVINIFDLFRQTKLVYHECICGLQNDKIVLKSGNKFNSKQKHASVHYYVCYAYLVKTLIASTIELTGYINNAFDKPSAEMLN